MANFWTDYGITVKFLFCSVFKGVYIPWSPTGEVHACCRLARDWGGVWLFRFEGVGFSFELVPNFLNGYGFTVEMFCFRPTFSTGRSSACM